MKHLLKLLSFPLELLARLPPPRRFHSIPTSGRDTKNSGAEKTKPSPASLSGKEPLTLDLSHLAANAESGGTVSPSFTRAERNDFIKVSEPYLPELLESLRNTNDPLERYRIGKTVKNALKFPSTNDFSSLGPFYTAWLQDQKLFLSFLPNVFQGEQRTLEFQVSKELESSIKLSAVLRETAENWKVIDFDEFMSGCDGIYADTPGCDMTREGVLRILNLRGCLFRFPVSPAEGQGENFCRWIQKPIPAHIKGLDRDPRAVNAKVQLEGCYFHVPTRTIFYLIIFSGQWRDEAVITVEKCLKCYFSESRATSLRKETLLFVGIGVANGDLWTLTQNRPDPRKLRAIYNRIYAMKERAFAIQNDLPCNPLDALPSIPNSDNNFSVMETLLGLGDYPKDVGTKISDVNRGAELLKIDRECDLLAHYTPEACQAGVTLVLADGGHGSVHTIARMIAKNEAARWSGFWGDRRARTPASHIVDLAVDEGFYLTRENAIKTARKILQCKLLFSEIKIEVKVTLPRHIFREKVEFKGKPVESIIIESIKCLISMDRVNRFDGLVMADALACLVKTVFDLNVEDFGSDLPSDSRSPVICECVHEDFEVRFWFVLNWDESRLMFFKVRQELERLDSETRERLLLQYKPAAWCLDTILGAKVIPFIVLAYLEFCDKGACELDEVVRNKFFDFMKWRIIYPSDWLPFA